MCHQIDWLSTCLVQTKYLQQSLDMTLAHNSLAEPVCPDLAFHWCLMWMHELSFPVQAAQHSLRE